MGITKQTKVGENMQRYTQRFEANRVLRSFYSLHS